MEAQEILRQIGTWLLTSGIQIAIVLILTAIALRVSDFLSRKLFLFLKNGKDEEFVKRAETLKSVIRFTMKGAILVMAVIIILGEIGIQIGPILAAAGIVGLAVGFGAQNLVQDVISGFFILIEDQIRVGDVIQTAGKDGLVEKINLRMIVLRDLSGNVHYIRNGKIDIVTNMTKDYSRYVFDIGVAYREDVDHVIEVVKAIDEEMRSDEVYGQDILEPIEILGLDKFADSAVVIRARTKTKPVRQWAVGREFNRRIKKRFDELDIEIPFPHTTLYMGQDKEGQAPAMNVKVKKEEDGAMGNGQ
ncbi:MAG: mechanosensitive ion channel family protein [Desulfovibrionales bacterium]